jgi:hypothetical protein
MIRANAQAWQGALAEDGLGNVRRRPSPGVWSALEYGCHVRDVLRLYDERLGLMLTVAEPHYANWDQDATAVADRYAEQDPAAVTAELHGPPRRSRPGSRACPGISGSGPASAATGPGSPSNRSRGTSSTTRFITSTT